MNSVYTINKGINQPITFKGLKAQYIGWLGGGVLCLFIGFAILYVIGVPPFVCLGIIAVAGMGVFGYVYRLSHRYGEHGLIIKAAKRRIPRVVKCTSRKVFF